MADALSKALGLGLLTVGLVPGSAMALPWDIDMVDAYFYRAYEWSMQELPEGTVARNSEGVRREKAYQGSNNSVAGGMFLDDIDKSICRPDHEGYGRLEIPQAVLQEPPSTDGNASRGEELFSIYCATCHGPEGRLGAPVMAEGRFLTAAPPLSGGCEPKSGYDYTDYTSDPEQFCGDQPDQVTCETHCKWMGTDTNPVPKLCDAGLFSTIRNGNGSQKMPGAMRGYHQAMDTDEIWSVVNYVRNLPGNDLAAAQ